jgi:hypothetical protein
MQDRRTEPRLLCADLIEIEWKDKNGRRRRAVANLEDISLSGACLQMDLAIPLQTKVTISYANGDLLGVVKYCVYHEIGYFVGVQFNEGVRWSQRQFRPMHLVDPRRLRSQRMPGSAASAVRPN